MKIVIFAHSLASCWNHGNAHFLRGVARALIADGHAVQVYEPADGWSLANLRADGHDTSAYTQAYPELTSTPYTAPSPSLGYRLAFPSPGSGEGGRAASCALPPTGGGKCEAKRSEGEGTPLDLDHALQNADLVLVHEWNDPALVAAIGAHRIAGGHYTLFFHDTHHRAVSDPGAIRAFDLGGYDAVLAFGAVLTHVYQRWGHRAFTWHEAADTTHFHPPARDVTREGLVWIGNWGDDERSAELETYLLRPAAAAGLSLDIHGVRYPPHALAALAAHGARYHGWLANAAAPQVFARHLATVHVPRRHYTEQLPGIPTIRVFEALACGIPLLSAPWDDSEHLFRVGQDFLMLDSQARMTKAMRDLAHDPELRASLAAHGLETIRARHTCAHRAAELLDIASSLLPSPYRGEGQPPEAAGRGNARPYTPPATNAPSPLLPYARISLPPFGGGEACPAGADA